MMHDKFCKPLKLSISVRNAPMRFVAALIEIPEIVIKILSLGLIEPTWSICYRSNIVQNRIKKHVENRKVNNRR